MEIQCIFWKIEKEATPNEYSDPPNGPAIQRTTFRIGGPPVPDTNSPKRVECPILRVIVGIQPDGTETSDCLSPRYQSAEPQCLLRGRAKSSGYSSQD